MKKFLLVFILTLPFVLLAQEINISGKVTDAENAGIPGATILVKGTQTGTITNLNGEYTISSPADGILVISFIGYQTLEIPVSNRTVIDVQLSETSFDMDEVVVVGYGTSTIRDVTGMVANVRSEDIIRQTNTNIAQSLQGMIAGISISNNGSPGTNPTVRVRGLGSVSSVADPLYVVDGVMVGDINFLSPYQIENVTVLKDASSSAIYGNKAANGVIIVTTKKGRNQKPLFTYNGYVGMQMVSNLLEMANKDDYITLYNEKLKAGFDRGTSNVYQPVDPSLYTENTNWYDEILRTAQIQNHDINITGGTEVSTYNFGIGITSQEGIVKNNDFTRINLRGGQDINVNKILNLGYSTILTGWRTHNPANVLMQAYISPPAYKPMINDTTFTNPVSLGFGNFGNPSATLHYHNNVDHGAKAFSNLYAELTPIRGLSLRSAFNFEGTFVQNRNYVPRYVVSNIQTDTTQTLTKMVDQVLNYTFDNTATYDRAFDEHRFKIMGGLSFQQVRHLQLTGSTTGVPFFSESTLYLSNGSLADLTASDVGQKERRTSYFGRAFYSFRERYLITLTMRRDGSSFYPKNERWGNFPSVGVGWVLSEEDFLADSEIFNFLKVRASWGKLGNDNIPQNAYTVLVNDWGGYSIVYGPYGSNAISQGASITSIVEPLLKWETVEEYDAGLEALTFKSRLNIELDYYYRMTRNAIFPVPLIATSGTAGGSFLNNNADILNRGVELTLNWKDKISDRFSYTIGGNISTNHNEVYKLQKGTLPFYDGCVFNGNLATYTQEGHPIGEFYVYEAIGVFQDITEVENYKSSNGTVIMPDAGPGDLKFKDRNDDGIIDNFDRKAYGSYTPTLLYAFRFGFQAGPFDMSADFQGVGGNKIYNAKRPNRFGNENWDKDFVKNRWHGPETSNDYPSSDIAGGKNAFPSSFFIESGAYFRVKNIQVGYTIPSRITDRINAGAVRIYATAQNPFTFFSYNGFSPEIPGGGPSTQGIDMGVYPLSRITSVGLNINF